MDGRNVEAKSLRRHRDKWVLVLEELIRVGSDHYKPRRTQIRGQESILRELREMQQVELAEAAQRAMGGTHHSYRVRGSRLERAGVRKSLRPMPAERAQRSPKSLHRLERRCAALEEKVERLERAVKALTQASVRPESADPSGGPGPSRDVAAPSEGENKGESKPGAAERSPVHEEPPIGLAKPKSVPPKEQPIPAALRFPAPSAYGSALGELTGRDVSFRPDLSDTPPASGTHWVAELKKDDETLGAIVVDVAAVAHEGGSLAMLDDEAREAMVTAAAPSPDALDAMNEVIQTLARCLKDVPENPHVRSSRLMPFDPTQHAFALESKGRLGLASEHGGRIVFLSL